MKHLIAAAIVAAFAAAAPHSTSESVAPSPMVIPATRRSVDFSHGISALHARDLSSDESIALKWKLNDNLNGVFVIEIGVGTPPQKIEAVLDIAFSDIFIHSSSDEAFAENCKMQTPYSTCWGTFNNCTSSTFHQLSNDSAFNYTYGPWINYGPYISDVLEIGKSKVKSQTIALATHGEMPVSLLGTAFRPLEYGVTDKTFPEYPTFIENLVAQKQIQSATFSVYLSPSEGALSGADTFPDGSIIFGGLDTSLADGDFVTLPAIDGLTTTVASNPKFWNIQLSSVTLGHAKNASNLVPAKSGDSCVLDAGTAYNLYNTDTYNALISALGSAGSVNASTGVYEVPCSARFNSSFDITHTFSDPRDPKRSISLLQPASETIWTQDRIIAGGEADRCGLANVPFQEALPGFADLVQCVIGVSGMKDAYWVFDMHNKEVSIAKASAKQRPSHVVSIPEQGISGLGLAQGNGTFGPGPAKVSTESSRPTSSSVRSLGPGPAKPTETSVAACFKA
ncbi:hypothetical protein NQ176_g2913 [Zarea fungicola]|uniref:Uncharacterized protein n=1 Tax=Zarea fungicola TaxID=93591 RepID=A0ACC1NMB1_9HYPO|nr:hypothetical protein NQ176_g2913 [Lecanicillium fungicola]